MANATGRLAKLNLGRWRTRFAAADASGRWIANVLILPALGVAMFLGAWQGVASHVTTSLGQLPGPAQVYEQVVALVDEHQVERAREVGFYRSQETRIAEELAADPAAQPFRVKYTGKPTFLDQIATSILTVMTGFLLGTLIAIPLGIICGLSTPLYAAINPLVQLFRPVSPLAWLPLVTIVVSAVYVSQDPLFPKSFINSAITVMLCCLWPTLVNTTVGVANVSRDLINVARVLRLGTLAKVRRIVLPSSTPLMFAGLRLSLGVGWMVVIAAEMLAQNPGLGKFVWDEFQNGSSQSLARIMVAVFAIGLIGFMLDRVMLLLQRRVTWDRQAVLR
ncbi:MAG: ABC transporter permease [Sulfuricaulis sp.]